jgi:hypothetical protein
MTSKLGPGVCAKLRTKTMYLNVEYRSDAEEPGCNNTAVYWCLKTKDCLGPDDLPANPGACGAGRSCAVFFEPQTGVPPRA